MFAALDQGGGHAHLETPLGDDHDAPPSVSLPIIDLLGNIEFRFKANAAKSGYEVLTIFPDPLDRKAFLRRL